jgi:hypothetical protein
MEHKEWTIYWLEHRYLRVSNHGDVLNENGKPLKFKIHKQGYPLLIQNFKKAEGGFRRYNILVQRLIAILFVDNPENKSYVIQIDGDKMNVRADNLIWATEKERYDHQTKIGARSFKSILNVKEVAQIKNELRRKTVSLVARQYQVSPKTINDIKIGKAWKNIQTTV